MESCVSLDEVKILLKEDVGGPHQRALGHVQEAPEKRSDVDEELQPGHTVGGRL